MRCDCLSIYCKDCFPEWAKKKCDHKMVDSKVCLKCGWSPR